MNENILDEMAISRLFLASEEEGGGFGGVCFYWGVARRPVPRLNAPPDCGFLVRTAYSSALNLTPLPGLLLLRGPNLQYFNRAVSSTAAIYFKESCQVSSFNSCHSLCMGLV